MYFCFSQLTEGLNKDFKDQEKKKWFQKQYQIKIKKDMEEERKRPIWDMEMEVGKQMRLSQKRQGVTRKNFTKAIDF